MKQERYPPHPTYRPTFILSMGRSILIAEKRFAMKSYLEKREEERGTVSPSS